MMQGLQRILLFQVLTYLGRNVHGSAIIRGTNAPQGSMPDMASLQGHICGGFLISEDFILTAAHCANGSRSVVLGTHNLRNEGQEILIAKRCKHPQYVNIANGNDIMLLKLSHKAQLGKGVGLIEIPQQDMNLTVGQPCQVFGWGAIRTGGGPVDDLMAVNVSIIGPQVCAQAWNITQFPPNMICAGGYDTDKGFCQGDSGGPLVCNGTAVGIVSLNWRGNCTYPTRPNVYTDISKFVGWIQNALTTNNCQE